MEVTLGRASFMQRLQTVQRAISSKTTIPILTGVKITLTQEGLALTGDNADISVETFLSVKDEKANVRIESTGSIVLQARSFSEIIRKLPEKAFALEILENKQVAIISGRANFIINGLDTDDYPHLPVVGSHNQMGLPVHVLTKLINETVFVVSQHESRSILTGVHFILSDSSLLAVATDSRRLSQRVIPVEQAADHFGTVTPGESLTKLSCSLTNEEEIVEISIMESQVLSKTETMYFYSRLLEGNYPGTNHLIPSGFSTGVGFSVPSFLAAIERASLLSHEGRNNIVRLSIRPDVVVLYENPPEIEEIEESLSYTASSSDPLDISFNPDYTKAALRTFGDMSVKVRFISAIRPSTLEPTEDGVQLIQLITPVRTN